MATESLAGAMEAVSGRFEALKRGGSMATACIAQVTFRFEPKGKPVVAAFDIPDASSDGGLVLLKGLDTQLGLTKRLAACVGDERQPAKVRHETIELLRQRVFGLAAGYADCNDAPWCYLPVVATVTFNDEAEQFAVAAVLRPGNAPAHRGARGLLRRLLRQLRAAFPDAVLRIRLDGGFASAKLFAFLEREQVEYVVAMASNVRLEKRARRLMGKARVRSRESGQTEHLYGATWYAARKWKRRRRVIIKAEVVRHPGRAPKNNPRFVVTNLTDEPQTIYQLYCQRGDVA